MESMRAVTRGAEAVERWDPQRGGEVSVRATAGRALGEICTSRPRDFAGELVQLCDTRRPLHRWTIDAAGDLEPYAWIHRRERSKRGFDRSRIVEPRDPHVHD